MSLSPAMQNYKDMKAKNKDYLLFYRLGDFMRCSSTTLLSPVENWI